MELMRRFKNLLDPKGILNPYKVLPTASDAVRVSAEAVTAQAAEILWSRLWTRVGMYLEKIVVTLTILKTFYVTKKSGSPLDFLLGSLLCRFQVFHLHTPKGASCKVVGTRLSFCVIFRYLVNSSRSWTERHLGLRLDYILNQVDSKIS